MRYTLHIRRCISQVCQKVVLGLANVKTPSFEGVFTTLVVAKDYSLIRTSLCGSG